MSTYLWVNLLSLMLPFLLSFEPRFSFYKKFWAVFAAIIPVGAFFIIWDVQFTEMGVWGFNPLHLAGINLFNLPIEEWIFFVTIPFASLFTYEVINYHFPQNFLKNIARPLSYALIVILLVVGILSFGKWYTSFTFLLTAVYLMFNLWVLQAKYLGQFYFAYALILIPFFIVNGILTGSFIEQEVVYYNDAENLGLRLFTIPIEDSIYGMLLILMNVNIFEWLLRRSGNAWPRY